MSQVETRLVHVEANAERLCGAMTVPVSRAVTYVSADPYQGQRYDYSRSGNPTRSALEAAMAELEGGVRGFAFASGNAALTAALLLFSHGDHLVVTQDCQGGTVRLFRAIFERFGIAVSYVPTDRPDRVRDAIRPNTRALWVENFSNPFLQVADIGALAEVARSHGLWLLVDNTLVTPMGQQPLAWGADVVLHSATKLISGHGDVTCGIAVAGSSELAEALYLVQNATGGIASPDDAYMVLRGLKTLPVRYRQAATTAATLANWLAQQPEVVEVFYPGLETHQGHRVAERTMHGYGFIVTLRLASAQAAQRFARSLTLVAVGAGFGGTETMLSVPELHCHAALTPTEMATRDFGGTVVRLSVGLEAVDDLQADLEQALHQAGR